MRILFLFLFSTNVFGLQTKTVKISDLYLENSPTCKDEIKSGFMRASPCEPYDDRMTGKRMSLCRYDLEKIPLKCHAVAVAISTGKERVSCRFTGNSHTLIIT